MKPRWIFPCLLTLLAYPAAVSLRAADTRPNIVIILADDMGYSDLGCYGSEIATPNLDALAATGLRYTSFYNATRCCPSRAALLTGLYPHQAGVADMAGNHPQAAPAFRGHLLPSDVTIAGALRPAGYRTMAVGKWHVGTSPGPIEAGFEDFYGFSDGYGVDYFDPRMMVRLPADHPDPRRYEPGQFYSTDAITDHALDFVADARQTTPGQPWFLYLAYNAAHFPLQAPRTDIEKYAHLYEKGWDAVRTERLARLEKLGVLPEGTALPPRSPATDAASSRRDGLADKPNPAWDSLDPDRRADLARRMAIYAATIDHLDQQIGRVVADLKTHGELDNTLLFFLSDNGACAEWDAYGFDIVHLSPGRPVEPGVGINVGTPDLASIVHTGAALEAMGGPGSYPAYGSGWANACNTPFRWYKHYGHEGGISTPLIVHWPTGFAAQGEFRPQVGHVMDLMSTCLDVAGAKYPERVDGHDITPTPGRSLVPSFTDAKALGHDFLAWAHESNRAVREGRWKLVAVAGHPWELYDIEADRTEEHDLAATRPEKVAEMTRLFNDWAAKVGAAPAGEPKGAAGSDVGKAALMADLD